MGARQGRSRPEGVPGVLHRSNSGSLAIWDVNVGLNAADGEVPGKFPVLGRDEDHGETTAAKEGRYLGITTAVGGTEGGRNGGDTDIN